MQRPGDELARPARTSGRGNAVRRLLADGRDGTGDAVSQRFAATVARAFGVPIANFVVVGDGRSQSFGTVGRASFETAARATLSGRIVATGETLVVEDVLEYPDRDAVSQVLAADCRFYAGAPLIASDGERIGTLAIIAPAPRAFGAAERETLRAFATLGMQAIEERIESLGVRSERDEFRAVIAAAPNPMLSTDREGNVISWNAAAQRLFGWTLADVRATNLVMVAPERKPFAAEALRRVIEEHTVFEAIPSIGITKDGRPVEMLVSAAPKIDGVGVTVGASMILEDASAENRRAERTRRRSAVLEFAAAHAPLAQIFACLADYVDNALPGATTLILGRDDDGCIVTHHGAAMEPAIRARVADLGRARVPFALEAIDLDHVSLADVPAENVQFELCRALLERGHRSAWRRVVVDSQGHVLGAVIASVPHERPPDASERSALGEACALAVIATEEHAVRARLERLALHDPLTGLPNRTLLEQRLDVERERALHAQGGFALAMIDLDRFKIINDSLGHAVGDQLLVEVGNRIRATIRGVDFVARLAATSSS